MLEPPARTTGVAGVVLGAIAGTGVRYATVAAWPGPVPALLTTLITTALACVALGLLATTDGRQVITSALTGFAGSVASLSILASIAISASPVLCAAYAVLTPISAIAGLGLGLSLGVKAHAVVDNA